MNALQEVYTQIKNMKKLSQEEIINLYASEYIDYVTIDEKIKQETDEEESKNLKSRKLYYVLNGINSEGRTYPSERLINKIVEGNLYLPYIYASMYYKKSKTNLQFDDLFQIASISLMSAAKYYVPNDKAKFTTYASKCINNKLRSIIYPKKKKFNFDNNLDEEILNLKNVSDILVLLQQYFLREYKTENSYSFLEEVNHIIKKFNRKMLLCGFDNKVMKRLKSYDDVIDYCEKVIKNSNILDFIDDKDIEYVNLFINYKNVKRNKFIYKTNLLIQEYLNKINFTRFYINAENELKKKNDDNLPTHSQIIKYINKKLNELNNRKDLLHLIDIKYFINKYYEVYDIWILAEENENDPQCRYYERKLLEEEYEDKLFDLEDDEEALNI